MSTFADTGLDARLLRALSKRGFNQPTHVQQEVIPKALEGKDVVARYGKLFRIYVELLYL